MSQKRHAVIILAPGFEETEAVTVIDVLRRAEIEVTVAGLDGDGTVCGSHNLSVTVDRHLPDIDPETIDLLVLPGGMPGAQYLADSRIVKQTIRQVYENDRLVAAICAAPIVLHAAGIIDGKKVTSYPSFREKLTGAVPTDSRVEHDGNVITSQGPGTALLFALELVRALGMPEKAEELQQAMLIMA